MTDIYFCPHCNIHKKEVRCPECLSVGLLTWYCGKEHLELDKTIHKETACRSFVRKRNEKYGMYLSSRRVIKRGDVIVREKPIVFGPDKSCYPICLGCYKRVDGSYRCSKCKWPMCNKNCEKSKDHIPECSFTGRKIAMAIVNFQVIHPFYDYIMPLRCLYLRTCKPAKYEVIKRMESHMIPRTLRGEHKLAEEMIKHFNLSEFTAREVKHVCGVVDVNGFQMPHLPIVGIYQTSSIFAHSCISNAYVSFNIHKEIVVKASVNIEADSSIFISYVNQAPGNFQRQGLLNKTKYFKCFCERCLDPTELGTHTNSLLCQKCKVGYCIPPIRRYEISWRCQSCFHATDHEYATSVIIKYHTLSLAICTKAEYEDFLEQTKSIFPENHFLRVNIKMQWIGVLDTEFIIDGYPLYESSSKMKPRSRMVNELLGLCDILHKGLNETRGILLGVRQKILMWKCSRISELTLIEKQEEVIKKLVLVKREILETYIKFPACGKQQDTLNDSLLCTGIIKRNYILLNKDRQALRAVNNVD